jgi:uncharacterized protein (TIGR00369 family)
MNEKPAPLPTLTDAPSGFRQLVGYRLAEWSNGNAVLTLTIGPRHLNRGGVVHGGVMTTLIDAAGGYAGCHCALAGHVRRTVTVSLSTQFLAQVSSGTIMARARVRGGGRKIFVASVEVTDKDGRVLAIGEGVYRYRGGSETPEGVPLEWRGEKRNTDLG